MQDISRYQIFVAAFAVVIIAGFGVTNFSIFWIVFIGCKH